MRKEIQPKSQKVVFQDVSTGDQFITRSTVRSKDTVEIDGEQIPLVKVEISSKSHPFFTGKQKFVDAEGRVKKFEKRYGISKS